MPVPIDFAEAEELRAGGRWDEAGERLAGAARQLGAAGVDFVVLCTNTMHKVAAEVEAAIGIPLLHLGDATAAAVQAAGAGQRRVAGHRVHHGAGLLP